MRVILEKKDVISLLGKAMGRRFEEKDVLVQADPFEVIIYDAEDVLVPDDPPPPESPRAPSTLEPKKSSPIVLDDDGSLDELHARSAELASRSPTMGGKGKKAKAAQRQLLPGESIDPRNPLDGGDADG